MISDIFKVIRWLWLSGFLVRSGRKLCTDSFLNFLNREKILASNKLAIDLQQGVLRTLRKNYSKIKDGGVRKGPFWVLVGAQMPAVLVEVGFVSNPIEAKRLITSRYQKRFAQGLAEGIERYFIKNP